VNEKLGRVGCAGPTTALKPSLGVPSGPERPVEMLVHSGVFRVAPLALAGASPIAFSQDEELRASPNAAGMQELLMRKGNSWATTDHSRQKNGSR
jgi:hypothetical protein